MVTPENSGPGASFSNSVIFVSFKSSSVVCHAGEDKDEDEDNHNNHHHHHHNNNNKNNNNNNKKKKNNNNQDLRQLNEYVAENSDKMAVVTTGKTMCCKTDHMSKALYRSTPLINTEKERTW